MAATPTQKEPPPNELGIFRTSRPIISVEEELPPPGAKPPPSPTKTSPLKPPRDFSAPVIHKLEKSTSLDKENIEKVKVDGRSATTSPTASGDESTNTSISQKKGDEVPTRTQMIIMRKKKSMECFADALVQSNNHISKESARKTIIMDDPQTVAVAATVQLTVPQPPTEPPPPVPTETVEVLEHTDLIEEPPPSPPPMQVPSEEEVFATKVKESFADRISKGFADLTQGSSDRLQRWKNKLQSSARRGAREKDTSEPPPLSRKMPSIEPADVQIEWSCSVPRTQGPRPLHASRSASNAIPSSISHNSIPTLRQQTSDYSEDMEHRTLKARENSTASSQKDLSFHYQNMKSLHDLVQTIEGYSNNKTTVEQSGALPPPARITPYSGVRPKDGGDLIRPIAFRPSVMGRSRPNEEPPLMKRQSATSSSSSNIFQRPQQNDSRPPANNLGQARSSLNLASTVPAQPLRPRGIYQPSTSSSNIASAFSRPEENDYDTVPDYVAKENDYSTPFSTNGSNANPAPFTQHSSTTSSLSSSNSTSAVHSPPTSNNVKRVGTSASRTGVHVTPSPSDSGIVDYETIIRDKENELRDVRMTMEQNEEIIVRVYLEKEKAWKEELSDLRLRLASANKDALRLQLHRCTQQQQQMAATIQNLTAEKQGLQRKCLQLEKEMFAMKARLDNKTCENCSRLNGGNSKAPIPAPRASKESSHDRELRDEVEVLKGEVGHLREALTGQINLFAEERRRWEQEKNHQAKTENRSVTVGRDRLI